MLSKGSLRRVLGDQAVVTLHPMGIYHGANVAVAAKVAWEAGWSDSSYPPPHGISWPNYGHNHEGGL